MPKKKYLEMSFITILYYLELAIRIVGRLQVRDVSGKHQFGLSIQLYTKGDFVAVIALCNALN